MAYQPDDINEHLKCWEPLGYTWEGRTFLLGEGEVSIERFNEVVGGDLGNGMSVTFSVEDDDEDHH